MKVLRRLVEEKQLVHLECCCQCVPSHVRLRLFMVRCLHVVRLLRRVMPMLSIIVKA